MKRSSANLDSPSLPGIALWSYPLPGEGLLEDWACAARSSRGTSAVVCDGAGGMRHAEKAARSCSEHFLKLCQSGQEAGMPGLRRIQLGLSMEISRLQALLNERRIATTLSALHMIDDSVRFFHVGDSRIFLFRNGLCEQLSQDHRIPQADVLSRALGSPERDTMDSFNLRLQSGDYLLLATDGLLKAGLEADTLQRYWQQQPSMAFLDSIKQHVRDQAPEDQASIVLLDAGELMNG